MCLTLPLKKVALACNSCAGWVGGAGNQNIYTLSSLTPRQLQVHLSNIIVLLLLRCLPSFPQCESCRCTCTTPWILYCVLCVLACVPTMLYRSVPQCRSNFSRENMPPDSLGVDNLQSTILLPCLPLYILLMPLLERFLNDTLTITPVLHLRRKSSCAQRQGALIFVHQSDN